MAKLDFPDASYSPWVAPNNVIYTYIGTSPNGYWEANTANASTNLTAVFVERTGSTMTGALKLDNAASVSLPDISFDGDVNTGLFSPGADSLAITTAGTQRFTVDSSGNVGIGTINPTNPLHVYHATTNLNLLIESGDVNAFIGFKDSNTTSSSAVYMGAEGNDFKLYTSGDERMRIDSSGRVGIGTTSPSHGLLTLSQSASSFLNALVIQQGNTGFTSSDGLHIGISTGVDAYMMQKENRAIFFGTADTERMRIDAGGDVAIGMTPAGKSLSIQHAANPTLGFYTGSTLRGELNITTGETSLRSYANSPITFEVGSERMRIDSSGNVGIGTSSPDFSGFGSATGGLEISSVNTSNALKVKSGTVENYFTANPSANYIWSPSNVPFVIGVNGTERMRIDSSGKVGIGVTPYAWEASSNSQALQVRTGVLWDYTSSQFDVGRNYYYDGSSYKYGINGTAERISFFQGNHIFSNASSGSANATLTWQERMRIRSNGDVIVGPYQAPATYGTVAKNIPYSIKVAPYGWQNGSEIASISMGAHGGTGQDDGQITFNTASNVHSSGNAGLQERVRILSTGGLTFNGDTAQVNALDDYEEGNFSPTISGSTGAGTTSYLYQVGSYVKIGNLVHIRAYVAWTSATGTGLLYLRNLPYSSSPNGSYGGPAINYWHNLTQAGAGVSALWGIGNDYVYFYNLGNPTASSVVMQNTGSIIVGGAYYIP